jgi:hypothetical protein
MVCCLIVICFVSFADWYILITSFMFFNNLFYICLLVLYVLLSILCVLGFCIVLFILFPHVYSFFSICLQVY